MSARGRIGAALLALTGIVAFALLGTWQLQRGLLKRDRLQQQQQALAVATPQPLAAALRATSADMPIRRVQGRGHYRPPLLLLDNQQRGGKVGVRAYGIARIDGVDEALLVELGWIAWSPQRELPEVTLPEGERDLAGLLAPWPGAGLALAANPWPSAPASTANVLLNRLERADVQRALGITVSQQLLKLAPEQDHGFERDLDLLPNTLPPERHYGYAVQWYALAATVLALYLILTWRMRRKATR